MKKYFFLLFILIQSIALASTEVSSFTAPLPSTLGGTGNDTFSTDAAVVTNGSNQIISLSSVSSTELGYLDGVTSSIQTQLSGKLTASNNLSDLANVNTARVNLGLGTTGNPIFEGTIWSTDGTFDNMYSIVTKDAFVTINSIPYYSYFLSTYFGAILTERLTLYMQTANTLLGTNANKEVISLDTATYPSLTELSYVKGVTSAIQTQLGNKAASGANTDITSLLVNNTGLCAKGVGVSNKLCFVPGDPYVADHTLTFSIGPSSDRTLSFLANFTVNQAVTLNSAGASSNVTFPNGTSTVATLTGGETLTNKTLLTPYSTDLVVPSTGGSGSPYNIASFESGSTFTNEGATAEAYFNLPTAAAGIKYLFVVQDADGLRIVANSGDTIRVGATVSATAGFTRSNVQGSIILLEAINATEWIAIYYPGTWTVDL